jgi:hypothetical protein
MKDAARIIALWAAAPIIAVVAVILDAIDGLRAMMGFD